LYGYWKLLHLITTNPAKTVFYTGMTNDLYTRMKQHYENRGAQKTFAGRYYCYNLIYFERHGTAQAAIDREKEIKGWSKGKKIRLIRSLNFNMDFLKDYLQG
jgi:putative endonuclease